MNAHLALGKCNVAATTFGLSLVLMAAPCFAQAGAQVGHSATGLTTSDGTAVQANGTLGVTLGMAGGHVVVTGVQQQGALTGLGLRPGDVITGINGHGVFSAADVTSRLTAAATEGTGNHALGASLAVARGGQQRILNLPAAALHGLLTAQANASAKAQATAPPFANVGASGEAAATESAASRASAAAQPTNGVGQTTAASNLMRDSLSQRAMTSGFGVPSALPFGLVPTTTNQATTNGISTTNQAVTTMPVPTPERPATNANGTPASFGEVPKAGALAGSTTATAAGTTTSSAAVPVSGANLNGQATTAASNVSGTPAFDSGAQVVMPVPTPERPATNAAGAPASFGEIPKNGAQVGGTAAAATGTTASPAVATTSAPQVVMPVPTPERPAVNASGAPASFGEIPKAGAQAGSTTSASAGTSNLVGQATGVTSAPATPTTIITPSGPRLVMPVPTPDRPAVNASGAPASFGEIPKAGIPGVVRPGGGMARPVGGRIMRAGGGAPRGGGGGARGGGGGGVKAGGS
jgi:hypothetical protein